MVQFTIRNLYIRGANSGREVRGPIKAKNPTKPTMYAISMTMRCEIRSKTSVRAFSVAGHGRKRKHGFKRMGKRRRHCWPASVFVGRTVLF